MIENEELTAYELQCLNILLSEKIRYKKEMIEQLNCAKVSREYTEYYLSLKFMVRRMKQKIPIKTRVPIEMRVYIDNYVPIQFLLHIIGGYISELEIFNADSSIISREIILDNAKIEIEIVPELR